MVAEAQLAERLTVARPGLSDAIRDVLLNLGLPVRIPDDLPREDILRAMRVDKKKNAQAIRFALPAEIGNVQLVDVSDLELVLE
jgi:3-dehydroquinate synthase